MSVSQDAQEVMLVNESVRIPIADLNDEDEGEDEELSNHESYLVKKVI